MKTYRPSPTLVGLLPAIRTATDRGEHYALRLTGPAGAGKTSAAAWLAESLGMSLMTVDCGIIREPRDILGSIMYDGTRTAWVDSRFAAAVEAGRCVVLLDELNRASSEIANALLPLLDHRRRSTILERGSDLSAGPGILWVATTNEGAEYSGAGVLDRAIRDRFARCVEASWLDPADESAMLREATGCDRDLSERLVCLARATRVGHGLPGRRRYASPLSPRHLLAAAADWQHGADAALAACIFSHYPDTGAEGERASLRAAALGIGLLTVEGGV